MRCDNCEIDIHRASFSRHLKSKKHLENIQQYKVVTWNENNKRNSEKNINLSDTKVQNQFYFTDRLLKIAYDINIENYHIKHANSTIPFTSKFNIIGIALIDIYKIMIERSNIYDKLRNPYKIICHLNFLVIFNKYGEDNEITPEIELSITLSITHILAQTELEKLNIQGTLETRIQIVEMKESGWIFQKINSMKISFYKSSELNGSSYVKLPLRSSALLNNKNDDKYCLL